METDTLPIVNQYECRLCFESDTLDNLIYPCKCSGTSKYIHKHCLNEWRTLADNREAYNKCFECSYQYQFKNNENIENGFCDTLIKKLSKNIFFFTIINFIIISLLGLFLFLIDKNKKLIEIFLYNENNNITNTTNIMSKSSNIIGYFVWGSLIYLLLLFILFFYLFFRIKNKRLYCKYYCKNKNVYIFIIAVLMLIVITMDIIFGLFILSVGLQYMIKNHLYSLEKLRETNNLEVLNYQENEDSEYE